MRKLRYIYGLLLFVLVTKVPAQLPAEQNNKAGFRKSAYGGFIMHTQGLGLNLYFSKFKRLEPSPNSINFESKLNSGMISCFLIVSKISSNLAFITFVIKSLLIFLNLELIK